MYKSFVNAGDASQLFAPFFSNGLQAVRIIDPVAQTSTLVATMQNSRYYPTILTMPSGMLLIVGGYQQVGQSDLSKLYVYATFCQLTASIKWTQMCAQMITVWHCCFEASNVCDRAKAVMMTNNLS